MLVRLTRVSAYRLLLGLSVLMGWAQPVAARWTPPSAHRLGVQVQPWRTDEDDLRQIRATGFEFVRWGIAWHAVETAPGAYNWAATDRFFALVTKHGLRSLITLASGAEEALPPQGAAGRAAFATFAAAAARRYGSQQVVWEIWNEPDLARFWPPRPDSRATALLVAETCRAMKKNARSAAVVGPASASLPNAMQEPKADLYAELVRSGAAKCLDGLSMHAYRIQGNTFPDPESALADYQASRSRLTRLRASWRDVPILISEWGYPSNRLPPEVQSAYLLRTYLVNRLAGHSTSVWYEWRDNPVDPASVEAHFGLLRRDGTSKVPLPAELRIFSRVEVLRRFNLKDPRQFAVLLRDGRQLWLATWLWSSDIRESAFITANGKRLRVDYRPRLLRVTSANVDVAASD